MEHNTRAPGVRSDARPMSRGRGLCRRINGAARVGLTVGTGRPRATAKNWTEMAGRRNRTGLVVPV